jgi:transcriptional regulator with XRE-family HTH domain
MDCIDDAPELNLRMLREMTGKTQNEIAVRLELSQAELSRAERRADHLFSTVRKYIQALGGRLEVMAVFEDKVVKLKDV